MFLTDNEGFCRLEACATDYYGGLSMTDKKTKGHKLQTLKTYEVRIDEWFKDGTAFSSNHIARTPSGARYAFQQAHSEVLPPFNQCFAAIKVRLIGTVRPEQFFGPAEDFKRMCELRGIPFAYQGMVVDVAGKRGWLVGSNYSQNMNVLFEGEDHVLNCHPRWETTFYDDKMNVIADFKESKQPAQQAV